MRKLKPGDYLPYVGEREANAESEYRSRISSEVYNRRPCYSNHPDVTSEVEGNITALQDAVCTILGELKGQLEDLKTQVKKGK